MKAVTPSGSDQAGGLGFIPPRGSAGLGNMALFFFAR